MLGLKLDESAQALLSLVQSAVAEDAPMTAVVPMLDGAPPAATAAAIPVVAELPPPASAPSTGSTEPPPPRRRPLGSRAPVLAAVGVDPKRRPPGRPRRGAETAG
jgi:hypothetical protein